MSASSRNEQARIRIIAPPPSSGAGAAAQSPSRGPSTESPTVAEWNDCVMEHVEDDLQQPELADWPRPAGAEHYGADGRMKKKYYEGELERLQEELVKLQHWVNSKGLRVLVIFEGRGSAGKGGVIKRISERTSPRIVRAEALPKPTEREQAQWYFQRYVPLLPSGGEIVLFDRSWYNRSNVEWVMGFCTEEPHAEFLRTCPNSSGCSSAAASSS